MIWISLASWRSKQASNENLVNNKRFDASFTGVGHDDIGFMGLSRIRTSLLLFSQSRQDRKGRKVILCDHLIHECAFETLVAFDQ